MKKVALCTLFALSLSGCASQSHDTTDHITIKQAQGEVNVPYNPQKVAVLDYGVLDSMVALGLGDRVVAIPNNLPDYLDGTLNHPVNAGGMKEPDLTVIAGQHPDLILTARRQDESRAELATLAPTLDMEVRSSGDYMDQFERNVRQLGDIFGKQTEARQQLAVLEKDLREARETISKSGKKTLVLLHNEGRFVPIEQPVVYGLLKAPRARAQENLPAGQRPAAITLAEAAALKPDLVFIVDRSASIGGTAMNPGLFKVSPLATQNVKMVYLDPALWYLSGAGLMSLNLQIDAIASAYR